ncbi:MAG: hypothetical protein ACP5I3_07855 [Thermoproteus sp.]|jgi:hypothetical protein
MSEEARRLAESGDYRGLAHLCLKILNSSDWDEAWAKASELAERTREYVILKFLAVAYALTNDRIYSLLTESGREFLARDLAVCVDKVKQLLDLHPL